VYAGNWTLQLSKHTCHVHSYVAMLGSNQNHHRDLTHTSYLIELAQYDDGRVRDGKPKFRNHFELRNSHRLE
jgi:hypothetical protein